MGNTIFLWYRERSVLALMAFPTPPLGRPLPAGLPVPRSKGKLMGVPGPQLLSRARRWRGDPDFGARYAPLPEQRSLLPHLAFSSARAPRGQTGGGRNFPVRGLPLPRNSFCLRRERGNGKGGEAAAGVRCAAPGPAQTP